MIIKNLTSETQSVKAISLRGDREFTFYVIPHGCKEILDMYIPNMEKLKGIFEVVTANNAEAKEDIAPTKEPQKEEKESEDKLDKKEEKEPEDDDESPEKGEEDPEKGEEDPEKGEEDPEKGDDKLDKKDDNEPQKSEGKFICDICGQEFASARGLSSHKNRIHLGEEK